MTASLAAASTSSTSSRRRLEIAGHKVERRGAGELVEDKLLGAAEELGQDAVRHYTGKMNRRFGGEAGGEVHGLCYGHLLGRGDKHGPGAGRVAEYLQYPVGLGTNDPHPDQLVDTARRRQLSDDVACRGGVDNDEVVPAGPDLETKLSDRQDLPDPRRGGRHEVEGPGNRADMSHLGYLRDYPQVLTQRRLGVHGHRHQVVADAPPAEGGRATLVGAGQVTFRLGLADESAATLLARQQGDRGRNSGLAYAAFTGDKEQLVGEELGHRARASVGSEADAPVLAPAADLDVGDLCGRHSHATASLVGEPEHAVGLGKDLVDVRDDIGVRSALGELDVQLLQ